MRKTLVRSYEINGFLQPNNKITQLMKDQYFSMYHYTKRCIVVVSFEICFLVFMTSLWPELEVDLKKNPPSLN